MFAILTHLAARPLDGTLRRQPTDAAARATTRRFPLLLVARALGAKPSAGRGKAQAKLERTRGARCEQQLKIAPDPSGPEPGASLCRNRV